MHVDEFHEELSMAERKKREAERMRLNAAAPNKQRFFMELNKKVKSNALHSDRLVYCESIKFNQQFLI